MLSFLFRSFPSFFCRTVFIASEGHSVSGAHGDNSQRRGRSSQPKKRSSQESFCTKEVASVGRGAQNTSWASAESQVQFGAATRGPASGLKQANYVVEAIKPTSQSYRVVEKPSYRCRKVLSDIRRMRCRRPPVYPIRRSGRRRRIQSRSVPEIGRAHV